MSDHDWTDSEMKKTIRVYLRHPSSGRRTKAQSALFRNDVKELFKRLKAAGATSLTFDKVLGAVNAVRSAELNRPGGASARLRRLWKTRHTWLDDDDEDDS